MNVATRARLTTGPGGPVPFPCVNTYIAGLAGPCPCLFRAFPEAS